MMRSTKWKTLVAKLTRLTAYTLTPVLTAVMTAIPVGAAFPGTNGKIAFAYSVSSGNEYYSRIHLINPDGTGEVEIVDSDPTYDARDFNPQWSPDGTKLVFDRDLFSFTVSEFTDAQIWVMNADGSGQRRLTNNAFADTNPTWSADGTRIAFRRKSARSATPEGIYVMNPDGSGQRALTSGEDFSPVWSPDGTEIAFSRIKREPGGYPTFNLWVMNADGTGQRKLTDNASEYDDYDPDWSADGTRIVFQRAGTSRVAAATKGIFSIARTGGPATRVSAAVGTPRTYVAGSPDATQLTYTGDNVIVVANADGSGARQITVARSGVNQFQSNWQPR